MVQRLALQEQAYEEARGRAEQAADVDAELARDRAWAWGCIHQQEAHGRREQRPPGGPPCYRTPRRRPSAPSCRSGGRRPRRGTRTRPPSHWPGPVEDDRQREGEHHHRHADREGEQAPDQLQAPAVLVLRRALRRPDLIHLLMLIV